MIETKSQKRHLSLPSSRKPLTDDHEKNEYEWNIEAVPDGRYYLKVVASDAAENSPERVLTGERRSEVIVVDRTAPTVAVVEVASPAPRTRRVLFRALDPEPGLSDIVSADYSLDGGKWVSLLPADKIFDASEETFIVTVTDLEPGEHTLVLRVEDAAGRVGAGKVLLTVKKK